LRHRRDDAQHTHVRAIGVCGDGQTLSWQVAFNRQIALTGVVIEA
jgi:hypothetical protein